MASKVHNPSPIELAKQPLQDSVQVWSMIPGAQIHAEIVNKKPRMVVLKYGANLIARSAWEAMKKIDEWQTRIQAGFVGEGALSAGQIEKIEQRKYAFDVALTTTLAPLSKHVSLKADAGAEVVQFDGSSWASA